MRVQKTEIPNLEYLVSFLVVKIAKEKVKIR
jgi:hypothetical protein